MVREIQICCCHWDTSVSKSFLNLPSPPMKCFVLSQIFFAKGWWLIGGGGDLCIKVTLLRNARVVLGLGSLKGCGWSMPFIALVNV